MTRRLTGAAKPAPALESLPLSGDEDDALDFVQQGRKFVIRDGQILNPREGRTGRARPAQPSQSGTIEDDMPITQVSHIHLTAL